MIYRLRKYLLKIQCHRPQQRIPRLLNQQLTLVDSSVPFACQISTQMMLYANPIIFDASTCSIKNVSSRG